MTSQSPAVTTRCRTGVPTRTPHHAPAFIEAVDAETTHQSPGHNLPRVGPFSQMAAPATAENPFGSKVETSSAAVQSDVKWANRCFVTCPKTIRVNIHEASRNSRQEPPLLKGRPALLLSTTCNSRATQLARSTATLYSFDSQRSLGHLIYLSTSANFGILPALNI